MVFRLGWLILGTSAAITNRVPNLSNNNIARDEKQQIEREREREREKKKWTHLFVDLFVYGQRKWLTRRPTTEAASR